MNKKNHVLIIAYHILPYTKLWGASQRVHYLAEHLIENNYNVTVIGANFGVINNSGKKLNYKSIAIDIKPSFFQKYQESFQNKIEFPGRVSINTRRLNLTKLIKKIFRPIYFFLRSEEHTSELQSH